MLWNVHWLIQCTLTECNIFGGVQTFGPLCTYRKVTLLHSHQLFCRLSQCASSLRTSLIMLLRGTSLCNQMSIKYLLPPMLIIFLIINLDSISICQQIIKHIQEHTAFMLGFTPMAQICHLLCDTTVYTTFLKAFFTSALVSGWSSKVLHSPRTPL